ncbi:MAG: DUF2953 domain-containing protein [Dethiobacter sp.]|nr:DUF2953 domain-containing protein [Dethiobacter sp.]
MIWYYDLTIGLALFLAAILAALFLPLRIFFTFFRENKIERAVLIVQICLVGIKLIYLRKEEPEIRALLNLGSREFRLPLFSGAGLSKKGESHEKDRLNTAHRLRGKPAALQTFFKRGGLNAGLKAFNSLKPLLKKISWKRFELEVSCGLNDPSLSGIAYGASWALTGATLALMQRYFTFENAPRIKYVPRFEQELLEVRWDGELGISLFYGAKLLYITRKIGGLYKWINIPLKV